MRLIIIIDFVKKMVESIVDSADAESKRISALLAPLKADKDQWESSFSEEEIKKG